MGWRARRITELESEAKERRTQLFEERDRHDYRIRELNGFLDNLALAVPEVAKYRTEADEWGNTLWDFDGLAAVVLLRQTERLADRYIPKPTRESNAALRRDLDEKREATR